MAAASSDRGTSKGDSPNDPRHVTELASSAQARRAKWLGAEAQGLDQLVLGHLALVTEFLDGGGTAELQFQS